MQKRSKDFKWMTARDAAFHVAIVATIVALCCSCAEMDKQEAAKLEAEAEAQHQAVLREHQEYSWNNSAEMAEEFYKEFIASQTDPELISLGEFVISHYCPCSECCGEWADGITATGTVATEGRTIAVDPDVIPYGTEVVVCYEDGTEHTYIAEDCGGAIKDNRIDVFMNSHEVALIEGMKTAMVYIVKE